MSWAAEDWMSGLSGRVLQKVRELQTYNEKLTRERQQRQLQLDNTEAALHKQKQKYDEVRAELVAVQRELVTAQEEAQARARAKERLAQELQVKTAQVCALEGQLDSARKLTQNLTQEIKRLEAELEKLQKGSALGESMLFSTPCWNMNWDQNGGKNGLGGDCDSKSQHVKQQLVFAESPKPSVGGASSQSTQQPFKTPPLRRRVHLPEASTPSSVFPWERDDTRSTPRGRPASSSSSSSSSYSSSAAMGDVISNTNLQDSGIAEALRKERDELCVRVSGLQQELQLQKERCKEAESRLAQIQKEFDIKEQNLTRSRDELARAHTRITQEGDRAQTAEQRVKQVQEELKCQRQNAETSRCNAEQRRKDMEREHQRELLELQRERQSMEKQHQQESNRLSQEIQQARTLHNTLQAQYDKLALQKQAVERDLEGVQALLKNTQTDLTESQKKETQAMAKLTESLRECESLYVAVEQLKKSEKNLEAEVKRLTEELAEALRLIKELQGKLVASPLTVSHSLTPASGDGVNLVLPICCDHSLPQQHSTQRKRTLKPGRQREANRREILAYPSNREPGEGIDSEHIGDFRSEDAPKLRIEEHEGTQHEAGRPSDMDIESSITEQDTGIEDTDTDSYMSDSTSERIFKDEVLPHADIHSKTKLSDQGLKRDSPSLADLKKENAALRDELRDVKQELERRLDDLEAQRRSETEARTKLKQLSKKHSSQAEQHRTKALELKEKESKLEAQLEVEKKENAKLRDAVSTLEKESQQSHQEKEESIGENGKLKEALAEKEKKAEQLEEDIMKMKKELETLQSELSHERKEREQEREEEKKKLQKYETEGLRIAELQAELDQLQRYADQEDKTLKDNMPLTYLQLGDQFSIVSDTAKFENELNSSPLADTSFCESVNLQNAMFHKESGTALITECENGAKLTEDSQPCTEGNISPGDLKAQAKTGEVMGLDDTTVLVLEVERMRELRNKEAERAKKTQQKLEALQKQVTSQTQKLTLAFESQSKHIEGLLKELQERDVALQRQEEELRSCQEEIASLKADIQMRESDNGMTSNSVTSDHEESAVSEEPSCDLVISSATTSTHDIVKDEGYSNVKDTRESQSDSKPCTTEEGVNNETDQVVATSEESAMPDLCGEPAPLLPGTSDVYDRVDVQSTTSTKEKGSVDLQTIAQPGSSPVVNTENTPSSDTSSPSKPAGQSDASEFLQKLLEYPPADIRPLKQVINELHKAQEELSLWKAKHEKLTLQLQEVSKEDYLSIKQENEQLKLRLKRMDEEASSQEPLLTHWPNTQQEDQSIIDGDRCSAGASSTQEELAGVSGRSGGGAEDTREQNAVSEDKAISSEAHVHSLQEELQALQTQIQLLSQQNREQAEELNIWRLSATSPEEATDHHQNGSSIVLVREDQLVLSCSPGALHLHSLQSRSTVQHRGLSQPEGCSDPVPGHDQRNSQQPLSKTPDLLTALTAKELTADNNSPEAEVKGDQEIDIKTIDSCSTPLVSFLEIKNSGDGQDLADWIQPAELNAVAEKTVSVSCEKQLEANGFRTERKEDTPDAIKTETKATDQKLNTGQSGKRESQKSHVESVSQCGGDFGGPSFQQTDVTNGMQTNHDRVLREEDAAVKGPVNQDQRSENTKVTREVKTVSTQTIELEREDEKFESSGHLQQKVTVLHAGTQTDPEIGKQSEDEEMRDDQSVDSPPLSPALAMEAEKLLFSGAFPIPADPASLAERIRRKRSCMSVAYDDTEYEPYGLPEVVMKGFADIPSGPACPYVLRRGLLGTDALPVSLREAPLKEAEEELDP